MGRYLHIACIQVNSGTEIADNLAVACDLARRARASGAEFICLPENVAAVRQGRSAILEAAYEETAHPALGAFKSLAAEIGVPVLVGTLAVLVPEEGGERAAARSFLIGPSGAVLAHYDKIHMFDVDLPDGESYRESATYRPGSRAVVADIPQARIGLSVCYDVRFAYLYRALAQAGAEILTVPAAFTRQTGEAHWHTLLRARAIETGCFVVAPAQTGTHDQGRQTYGHSLIVDPWGRVLADGGTEPGVVAASIDLGEVAKARTAIAALKHDRKIGPVEVATDSPLKAAVAG
ncbi:MAG: carbon-nitrogen hydrolase family protein [Rhodospirillaceae bacterium]|nr:carbon-nitrogen hydrolase family protein [Rhodospirillaceae bacterium]